jgi:gamma-glutamylcyclotransferase (GGCT)/AIG2-like uncharacterized protein YtfP
LRSLASVRLFVYGSLKRGGLHHAELAGAPFVGDARSAPGFRLVPLRGGSPYWALVPAPETSETVPGELFDVPVDALSALDAFEGEDYERAELPLSAAGVGGKSVVESALAYFKRSG